MSLYAQLLPNRQILSVEGEDTRTFLQGLVTNDVMKLAHVPAIYAAMLTPKGRYLFDFIILRAPEGVWLDVHRDRAGVLLKVLTLYKLKAKVRLAVFEPQEMAVACIWEDEGNKNEFQAPDGGQITPDPRLPSLGWRLYGPIGQLEHGIQGLAQGDYARYQLGLGVPEYGTGLVPEKTIVLEANLDELGAMDWKKGCYVGQELMARTHHQGMLRKRFFPFEGPQLAPDTPLEDQQGQAVGKVVASLPGRGIASMRLESLRLTNKYAIRGLEICVSKPDWLSENLS